MSNTLYLLIVLSLLASPFSPIGVNFIKAAALQPPGSRWQYIFGTLGILSLAIGTALDIASLQFGPQTLKATLSAAPILINPFVICCFARRTPRGEEKESFVPNPKVESRCHKVNNVIILLFLTAGLVVSALSFVLTGSFNNYDFGADAIYLRITSTDAIVFQAVAGVLAFILAGLFCFSYSIMSGIVVLAASAGVFSVVGTLCFKAALHFIGSGYITQMIMYGYGGLLATIMQLLAFFASIGLHKRETSTQVYITIFTMTYIIGSLISGGVVYDEFDYFVYTQWISFSIGLGCSFAALIAWGIINK